MTDPTDHYSAGYRDALALRASRAVREALLRVDGPSWHADRLRGFLEGHEMVARVQTCTCHRCPIHHDGATAPNPDAN